MGLFDGYWPWWMGAIALATMGLLYYAASGKAFGVSSTFALLPHWLVGGQQAKKPLAIPMRAQLLMFCGVILGGMLAAWSRQALSLRMDLGPEAVHVIGQGAGMWAVLLVGGVLVGFGARMMGGCTSGHGLGGCSRLEPGSLLGTATFCAAAVATAFAFSHL